MSLSNECGTALDNINVITIGNGKLSMRRSDYWDGLLRHVHLETMSMEECERRMKPRHKGPFSVICANSNDGASIAPGDSGRKTI